MLASVIRWALNINNGIDDSAGSVSCGYGCGCSDGLSLLLLLMLLLMLLLLLLLRSCCWLRRLFVRKYEHSLQPIVRLLAGVKKYDGKPYFRGHVEDGEGNDGGVVVELVQAVGQYPKYGIHQPHDDGVVGGEGECRTHALLPLLLMRHAGVFGYEAADEEVHDDAKEKDAVYEQQPSGCW